MYEPNEILRTLGERVRRFRTDLGISQEELGFLSGLDRTYISDIERGRRNVSLININSLGRALQVDPAHLISETQDLTVAATPNYVLRREFNIDCGFEMTGPMVLTAARQTAEDLQALPFSLFRSIDLKALSGIVGALFATHIARQSGAIVNPIEKGHPDVIPARGAGATEAELRNYGSGLEIKCTVGGVVKGSDLSPGDQRLEHLTGITWQAHHRHVTNLMGLVIDFAGRQTSLTCSPKTGPVTMRVQQPTMGIRRTLYGQKTLPGADHPQAPPSRSEARFRLDGVGGGQGAGYKRGYLPPLEEPVWRDEHQRSETSQGTGVRERPPQEASRRKGAGHRHPQRGEPGKLLSPTRRRAAVEHVRQRLGVSERRACRVIGQTRSSQRYEGRKANRDRALVERMVGLSRENPRYGYRRVWALLRREGWTVNKKRVYRLWRQEGLKVPDKQRKRRRLLLGESENGCTRRRSEHKNHVWSYDFVMDLTEDGRRLKMMPIVDEYTRECLSIEVERSITAEDVVATLASLFRSRGEPAFIRSDNGPEFIAKAVKRWLEASEVKTLYIEPGSPWENAYSETFISRFGDELLKREVFADLLEAKVLVEDYRGHYNHHRPHSALGYQTPAEFAGVADLLDRKVENAGKPEELESILTLS